ncbi:hypothetical protein Btru_013273, partial [Bulinus truncatus]
QCNEEKRILDMEYSNVMKDKINLEMEYSNVKEHLEYLNEKYTVEIQKLKEELVGQNRLSQLEIGSLKRKLAESKQENESLEEDIHKLTKSGPRNFRRNDTNDTDLGILKSVTGRREDRPGKKVVSLRRVILKQVVSLHRVILKQVVSLNRVILKHVVSLHRVILKHVVSLHCVILKQVVSLHRVILKQVVSLRHCILKHVFVSLRHVILKQVVSLRRVILTHVVVSLRRAILKQVVSLCRVILKQLVSLRHCILKHVVVSLRRVILKHVVSLRYCILKHVVVSLRRVILKQVWPRLTSYFMSLRCIPSLIMRAIRVAKFGGVENLKLESNLPVPTPADSEVLIKVYAAGVNPVDTYIRSGTYSRIPQLPYTPGQDAAGIVEAVGEGVTQLKKGDRVLTMTTTSGTYAEFTTANVKFVAHLDEKLSFAQGASFGVPYYTAYKSLFIRAQGKPGETVFVHGASGGVGLAAVQLAKAHGLRVVGTAGTQEGIDLVKKNGADFVFNHREEGYFEKISKQVEGGIDIVLEMLANVNLQNDLNIVNFRGRIVVVGCRGSIEINPRVNMMKESNIMGVALMTATEAEWKQMHAALEAGQKAGFLAPHVGKTYPLEEAANAQNDVINNTGTLGNLILQIAS